MPTHVASLTIDLHLRAVHSLKEKRAVIRPILEGCRRRFSVAAAEVDFQDRWQRAAIAVAAVSGSATQVRTTLDAVERFVWSFPEVEVSGCRLDWMEAGPA
ncbi:MAG: DUF503 domain-containing protein [Acidimicrobiales bacterium]